MSEFEWQQQGRRLAQPVAPQRDLWPQISSAIAARPRRRPRRLARVLAVAAALAGLALLLRLAELGAPAPRVDPTSAAAPSAEAAAVGAWRPRDPRLAAAAVVLDAAQMEVDLAVQQNPSARFLQGQLLRIQRKRAALIALERSAG